MIEKDHIARAMSLYNDFTKVNASGSEEERAAATRVFASHLGLSEEAVGYLVSVLLETYDEAGAHINFRGVLLGLTIALEAE